MLNLAVVGHVEWVTHTDAPFIPPAGEIVHLTDPLIQPAGGGAVTAAALVRMGAAVQFFTAAGDDVPVVEAMEELGVRTYAAPRPRPAHAYAGDARPERRAHDLRDRREPAPRRRGSAALGLAGGLRRRLLHGLRSGHPARWPDRPGCWW